MAVLYVTSPLFFTSTRMVPWNAWPSVLYPVYSMTAVPLKPPAGTKLKSEMAWRPLAEEALV